MSKYRFRGWHYSSEDGGSGKSGGCGGGIGCTEIFLKVLTPEAQVVLTIPFFLKVVLIRWMGQCGSFLKIQNKRRAT